MFFQGGASSLGGHSVKVCSFFPLWLPVERIVATDSFLGLNLMMCLFLGSVYVTWHLYYGAIFHKQTPKEVILLGFCLLLC